MPQNLTPSFFGSERWYGKIAMFKYELRAQFHPTDQAKYIEVNKKTRVSIYSGWKEITIKNPLVAYPPTEPIVVSSRKDISMGFLGLGKK